MATVGEVAQVRTSRASPRDLIALMAGSTLIGTTFSFAAPLVALVLEARGHGAAVIGANTAVAGLGVFLIAPVLPILLARLGARAAILLGAGLVALSLVLLPLSDSLLWWFAVRLLMGLGLALPFVLCEAGVNALADDRRRGRIMGLYGTLFCIGYAAGPLLVLLAGTEGWLPFLLAAAVVVLGALPIALATGLDRALATPPQAKLGAVWRRAVLPLSTILAFGLVETALLSLFPVYGLRQGLTAEAATAMLSVLLAGNIVLQLPIGWLADRLPRRLVLLGTLLVAAAGLAILPWLMGGGALGWALLLLLGGALGGLYTLSLTLLGERFTGGDLAVANLGFAMLYTVGAIVGPGVAGLAMEQFGHQILPALLVTTLLVVALRAALPGRAPALDS